MKSVSGAEQGIATLNTLLQINHSKINLTNTQLVVFQRCWAGHSYQEIAAELQYEYDYIKQVGSQLWRLLSQLTGERVSKSNFQPILLRYQQERERKVEEKACQSLPHCSWGEAIDVSVFFDRTGELDKLCRWIQRDRCRLITLLGMGGMGKTALSVKLAEQLTGVNRWGEQEQQTRDITEQTAPFQFLFWKALRDAPPLPELLTELLRFLSLEQATQLPAHTGGKLSLLLEHLQQHRCLIVLDNFDALLAAGEQTGNYRAEYEDYGELLRRLGEIPHQSCVVLTSREKPQEVTALAGEAFAVRVLPLQGLSETGGQKLLQAKGLSGSNDDIRALVDRYGGNPLALKIAATSIQDLFAGHLTTFLRQGSSTFNGINHLLQQQIKRLSSLELQLMYWLTINRETVSVEELQADITPTVATAKLLEALESLAWRSLIEKSVNGFTQQPVVMEYITEQIVEAIAQEILEDTNKAISNTQAARKRNRSKTHYSHKVQNTERNHSRYSYLKHYALIKATAKDYIRDSQTRMLVEPIVQRLAVQLSSTSAMQNRLYQILEQLRQQEASIQGYSIGNLINLLRYLQVDLTGADFSRCQIWQAYLPDANLHHVNFSDAELAKCVFAETFGGILSITFNPVGQQLAIADSNGEIRVWNLLKGEPVLVLKAHSHWIWSIAISPDGRLLASASDDNTAKIWSLETGHCLRTITAHTHSVLSVAFSPDGRWLATSSDDCTIRLWDMSGAAHDQVWQDTHERRVWSLCFSPDSQMLASSSEDRCVKLWQVETGVCLQTLRGHTDWIRAIAFHPTAPLFASGSHDQTIHLWDITRGDCLQTFKGHAGPVTAVAFSPDGHYLVSSSHDQTVRVWQVSTGQCLKLLQGHSNRLWAATFSSDRQLVASGGDDNAAKLWDWQRGCCTKTFQGHTNALLPFSLSPDHSTIASGHEDETVKLWDMTTGRVVRTLRGHSDRVWFVSFAPEHIGKNLLASGSGDGTIKLWNWRTGACLKTLVGHESWVWSVAFHPKQPILASSSYDATVKLWDVKSGACLQTLQGHTASVVGLCFSHDGKQLMSCGFDHTIRSWDLESGLCVRVLQGHDNTVWQLALSPDGQQLASCSYDQTVKLWDMETGNCVQTLQGHTAPIVALAFTEDGKLFSAGFDQTIRLWELATGACLQTLQGHQGIISHLLLHDRLFSGSFDETIKIWDRHTGDCLDSWRTPRPYEGLNITGIKGLTEAQCITLKALGATEVDAGIIPLFAGRSRTQSSVPIQGNYQ